MTINDLKARAYDIISQREFLQSELNKVNGQIVQEMRKEQGGTEKIEEPKEGKDDTKTESNRPGQEDSKK